MSSNMRAWTSGMGSYSGSVVRACWMMNDAEKNLLASVASLLGRKGLKLNGNGPFDLTSLWDRKHLRLLGTLFAL